MYEQHFGLRARPFDLAPDPRFLLLTRRHETALTLLQYGLQSRSPITVLTGEIGSGKTTLVRHLVAQLGESIRAGLMHNTHRGSGRILQWVAVAFDLPGPTGDPASLYRRFVTLLRAECESGRRLVLVVDEAQNLSAGRLEELRLLSNVNGDDGIAFQLVLVGQPELRETLSRPRLRQLAQRVGIDCHLDALGPAETHAYVRYRLAIAGGDHEVFDESALDVVHAQSGGVPRLINQLCDLALVSAYAEQRRDVDAALVQQVAEERQAGGIFPRPQADRRQGGARGAARWTPHARG